MRYTEIITEANYRNYFDTATTFKTDAEFKQHVGSKFGALQGVTAKESKPQAGGAVYIIDPNKGIVGYKKPNEDSPSGFVWYSVKEPFMPATKGAKAEPAKVEPAKTEPVTKQPVTKAKTNASSKYKPFGPALRKYGVIGAIRASYVDLGGVQSFEGVRKYIRSIPELNDVGFHGYKDWATISIYSTKLTTEQLIQVLENAAKARPSAAPAAQPPVTAPAKQPVSTKPAASLENGLHYIQSEMQHIESQTSRWSMAEWYGPQESEHTKGEFEMECRHWGNWQVPDDVEDDGDYDWEELSSKSRQQMRDIMQNAEKRYPHIKFGWQTGEKNYIYISAKMK